jgi:hypothetical protein
MAAEKPTVAFVLSLLAGIFILLGGGMTSMMGLWFGGYQGQYPYYGGMMGGYYGNEGYNGGGYGWMFNMMNGYGYGMMRGLGGGFGLMGVLGLVFGIIVIVSAVMLYNRPTEHTTWGVLVLVFSVLSAFGSMMGGFGVGVILGVIGGVLAILWKPVSPSTTHS